MFSRWAQPFLLASLCVCAHAHAQALSDFKIEPSHPRVGQIVQLTANLSVEEGRINCGLRVHWGDGRTEDLLINQPKDVPAKASTTYAKPGNYTVSVETKKVKTAFKCNGKDLSQALTVAAAPIASAPLAPPVAMSQPSPVIPPSPHVQAASAPASAPAKAAATVAAPCPSGWALAKSGVNKKTKAFSCTAKPGTAVPEPKLSCPGDLTYFENVKKGQLGCRP